MEVMKNIKAAIFDLDDTLYPEIDYITSGFNCVAKYLKTKIDIDTKDIFEQLSYLFKENMFNVFDRFLEENNYKNEVLLNECIEIYRKHYPDIKLFPDSELVLCWLKNQNFKIGIITDGRPEGQWNKIRALNIKKYTDYIIVTDELGGVKFRKPNDIPYKIMLEKLGIDPEESVYIGDNPSKDFITSNKLGMNTIMVRNNFGLYKHENISKTNMAKVTVNHLAEIINHI